MCVYRVGQKSESATVPVTNELLLLLLLLLLHLCSYRLDEGLSYVNTGVVNIAGWSITVRQQHRQ